jgi:hypothetical protein
MRKEVADIIAAVITAILALMTALAWNSVIQNIIRKTAGAESSLFGVAIYAIIITAATIIIALWIHKLAHKVK